MTGEIIHCNRFNILINSILFADESVKKNNLDQKSYNILK